MRPFENVATLIVRDSNGVKMRTSAVLYQDIHHLHANRISLIGSRAKELELMRLKTDGVIDWEMFVRPDWKLSDDPDYSHRQSGTGWVVSRGMATGVMIADDSIQPFADIEILEFHDRVRDTRLSGPLAEYVFLQRPRRWHVSRASWRVPDPPRLAGRWTSIKPLGVRFRLLRLTHRRDDDRTAKEYERIELPGIEIAPIDKSCDETEFFISADRLWFLFRVLLAFRFRQFVYTLIETRVGAGLHDSTWHSVSLEPRNRDPEQSDAPFLAPLEPYLAKGAAALLQMEDNRELLHAAAFGYATSYSAGVMESGLTACVEAIERLLEAFEQANDLNREMIDRKRWKKLAKGIRKQAEPLVNAPAERDAMQRALGGVPMMHLFERITRMVKAMRPKWRIVAVELLNGAPAMIKARNDIVHGRLVDDYSALRIELLRAQSLFERLWLGLVNCGDLKGSGWPLHSIRTHDAENEVALND